MTREERDIVRHMARHLRAQQQQQQQQLLLDQLLREQLQQQQHTSAELVGDDDEQGGTWAYDAMDASGYNQDDQGLECHTHATAAAAAAAAAVDQGVRPIDRSLDQDDSGHRDSGPRDHTAHSRTARRKSPINPRRR
jgi:hypothetical protein